MTASFLQCWAGRARDIQGSGVPKGRSACDTCGKTLSARDLIPIIGWIVNKGRARCCGAALHPTLIYCEVLILLVSLWGILVVPWALAVPTLVLASGLQAVVLLTGPEPKAARGFAAGLVVLGLAITALVFEDRLLIHAGATLLGLVLWLAARLQRTLATDALFLLLPAGAFLGFQGLAIACFVAIPIALAFRTLKPLFYPSELRRPVMPGEAVVFGLAAAVWIVWLYFMV
jgi:leader peptidase (prepilin peptidase)/N-methyltransferase